jgi:hypothetical protein
MVVIHPSEADARTVGGHQWPTLSSPSPGFICSRVQLVNRTKLVFWSSLTAEYNCDIQKLNEHVIVLEEGLTARGETSQDTMMNVQAAYMVCKDADFVRHAKDEYARWEQGANMSLKEYMNSCLLK